MSRTHWVAKFRAVSGPAEAADWKLYCPQGGNKLSEKQAFQRVVLDEIWMNFSQNMPQRRSWGLAENGLFYFGLFLDHKKTHKQQIAERCPVPFLKAWLQQFQHRSEQISIYVTAQAGRHSSKAGFTECFEHSSILSSWKNSSDLQRWITHRLRLGEVQFFVLLPDSNLFLKFQNNYTAELWATFSDGLLLQRIFWNFSGIFIISIKADTRNFSKKYHQNFLLDAIFFEQ